MQDLPNDGIIYLVDLRFPQHGSVQAWLNGTEYGEVFELMTSEVSGTHVDSMGRKSQKTIFVPALKPKQGKDEFLYVLQGFEETQQLAEKYTKMILDFTGK